MVERRRQPIRNQPNHGGTIRGAKGMPRTPWEASRGQADRDQTRLREQFVNKSRSLFHNQTIDSDEQRADTPSLQPLPADEYEQGLAVPLVDNSESKSGVALLQPLPADAHEQQVIELLADNKAIMLTGEPGSGKSTRFPHFTYNAGYDINLHLVPRTIIADGLHDRLVDEFGVYLGEEQAEQTVGVVHSQRHIRHEDNSTIVMTPNTFVRMLGDLRKLYGDRKVVINNDEIHEANVYTEIAMGVAALAVSQIDSWKLVATSATLNSEVLKDSLTKINNGKPAPIVEIEGRPFDLEMHERPDQSVTDVYSEVGESHERLLVFTSGKAQIAHIIKQLTKSLEEEERGSSSKVEFRILHGELTPTMKEYAVSPNSLGRRVVIVATPFGMSGITIPGVTGVITDGTINRPELDDDIIPGTERRYLAKSEIIQELGRAGRDIDGGVGYIVKPTSIIDDEAREKGKIVTEEEMPYLPFDQREPFGPPEIYNTNLGSVALGILANSYQFSEVNEYLPHPVQELDILNANVGLYRIGAAKYADESDALVISPIGMRMDNIPVRPELTRGLVEAQNNGRSLLQMTRLALIISAVESGGLQEFSKDAGDGWREFLRDTTADDMMAQFDIMSQLPFMHEDDIRESFITKYDLSYKRVDRALQVSRNMLKQLGVSRRDLVLTPPNQTEEEELRHDLTAGLIDSVYRKTGYYQKRQMYRNIHGLPGVTERYVSDRSVMSSHEHEYVAGLARWFKRGRVKHDIIELVMPVDPEVVAKYALMNNILTREIVGSKVVDGAVNEQYQMKFGSIIVGGPKTGKLAEETPLQSQEQLVQYVLSNQGAAQKALRGVVSELERYQQRVPNSELKKRLKQDSGNFMTSEKIEQLIRNAAKKTRIAYEIDRALSLFIYQANIGIGRYFTEEDREELLAMSPDEITVDGTKTITLHYESPEKPYITMPRTKEGKEYIRKRELKLPDGREVFVKVSASDGSSEYVSAKDV